MKRLFILLILLGAILCTSQQIYAQETITISGRVTDFDGNPIDNCLVQLLYAGFKSAKEVYTDKDGYYIMPNVEKGNYLAIYAIRPEEYPRRLAVPKEDMRLEFWAWNVIADQNLTINPRYDRLELYGTNVFKVERTGGGYFIYTRPMTLQGLIDHSDDIIIDKAEGEKVMDLTVQPEDFEIKVYADDIPLKVNQVQAVEEYTGMPDKPMTGYLIYVDAPEFTPSKPYIIFRIEALNRKCNERGENIYFYEVKNYKTK